MSSKKHDVPDTLLDSLLADYQKPEDLIGKSCLSTRGWKTTGLHRIMDRLLVAAQRKALNLLIFSPEASYSVAFMAIIFVFIRR